MDVVRPGLAVVAWNVGVRKGSKGGSLFLAQTGESTPGITGWLEVEVNGALVHSKKVGGWEGARDSMNLA